MGAALELERDLTFIHTPEVLIAGRENSLFEGRTGAAHNITVLLPDEVSVREIGPALL
jgi:hypothetical protein